MKWKMVFIAVLVIVVCFFFYPQKNETTSVQQFRNDLPAQEEVHSVQPKSFLREQYCSSSDTAFTRFLMEATKGNLIHWNDSSFALRLVRHLQYVLNLDPSDENIDYEKLTQSIILSSETKEAPTNLMEVYEIGGFYSSEYSSVWYERKRHPEELLLWYKGIPWISIINGEFVRMKVSYPTKFI